jgi:hypothetical protein
MHRRYFKLLAENPHYAAEYAGESIEEIYERRMLGASNDGDLPPCTDGIGP